MVTGNAQVSDTLFAQKISTKGAFEEINFLLDRSPAMTLDRNGQLGLGTTSPGKPLHIRANDAIIELESQSATESTSISFLRDNGGTPTQFAFIGDSDNSNDFEINVRGTDDFKISTNNLQRVKIDDTGKMDIGDNSNNIDLSIVGGLKYDDGNQALNKVLTSDAQGNATWQEVPGAVNIADVDNDTKVQVEENADDDAIRFDTRGNQRMIIDNDGKVGVGKAVPTARLDILSQVGIDPFVVNDLSVGVNDFIIEEGGNVGINVNDPTAQLHLVGQMIIDDGSQSARESTDNRCSRISKLARYTRWRRRTRRYRRRY